MSQITRDMLRIIRSNTLFRNEYLEPMGLKSCHASYLTTLCSNPGISQDKLAKLIFIDKSNVARQTVALEEAGYVTRTPSKEDRRIMQLYPTQKALDTLPKIFEMYTQWNNILTQDLTEEECNQLSELLAKIKVRAAEWMEAR